MTKKDYMIIADIIKKIGDDKNFHDEYIIKLFADTLKLNNSKFNYRKFWIACGGSF